MEEAEKNEDVTNKRKSGKQETAFFSVRPTFKSHSVQNLRKLKEHKIQRANTSFHHLDNIKKDSLKFNNASDCHPIKSPIMRIDLENSSSQSSLNRISSLSGKLAYYNDNNDPTNNNFDEININENTYNKMIEDDSSPATPLFPSMRILIAALLCCCFICISVSSSNMSVALICMIKCPFNSDSTGDLDWQSEQEGIVLAAQNAGALLMILTGLWSDRISGKWMVGCGLVLCLIGNVVLPLFAGESYLYAVIARLTVGAADACISPAVNSLITRWFPRHERAAAIGIITGGRQIGTLFILPTAGYLCTRKDLHGGWPAIFYLSAFISALVIIFWLPMGADKPNKQYCISRKERIFIESRIATESIGKRTTRRKVPWRDMLTSVPLWVGIGALICHEYPLVIMLQFLPNYMRDILKFAPTKNGFISTIPILCLFISKMASSSLSSYLNTRFGIDRTKICKAFNAVASAGLSLSVFMVPSFDKNHAFMAVAMLCSAMTFAGLHTPGVMTALLQLAPPFSGVITGLSFFGVAWFSIGNKILTKYIVQHGTIEEWTKVFYISGVVAALPIIFFTIWGEDRRQIWAAPMKGKTSTNTIIPPPVWNVPRLIRSISMVSFKKMFRHKSSFRSVILTKLTLKHREVIKQSFTIFQKNGVSNAHNVFVRMFKEYPDYKNVWSHFKDMSEEELVQTPLLWKHATSFVFGLERVIKTMDDEEMMILMINSTANQHKLWGLKKEHFYAMVHLITDVLMEEKGEPDEKYAIMEAWEAFYDVLGTLVEY
uniref:MFS domain-containing protein n=1 Tax=Parastrongyloides trichosuri TaxID=131310 RepID=A0A0N4Z3C4_PARTI